MRRRTSLDRHVRAGHVERLEHELRHVISVGFGVHRSFREHDGMFFRHNPELVGEGAVPDVLYGILSCRDAALDLRFGTSTKGNFARGAQREKGLKPKWLRLAGGCRCSAKILTICT